VLTLTSALASGGTDDIPAIAVRELGPFLNRDRHATDPGSPQPVEAAPVFYADVDRGVRVELTLPEAVPGLTRDALLMPRGDGGWEVFGDDGVLVAYDADAIHVSVSR
jgi:hypothetical protein